MTKRTTTATIRLPVTTLDRIREAAVANDRSTSYILRRLVEQNLDQLEAAQPGRPLAAAGAPSTPKH